MAPPPGAPKEVTVTLQPTDAQFAAKRITLADGQNVVIGRLPDGHTETPEVPQFASKVVSRKHAILLYQDGQVR